MDKKQYEIIFNTYTHLSEGNVNEAEIQEAFDLLPEPGIGMNNLTKMRAINSFIMFNTKEEMTTKLIVEQSDQNEVVLPTALKAGVAKVKKKLRRKTKVKRGRSKK